MFKRILFATGIVLAVVAACDKPKQPEKEDPKVTLSVFPNSHTFEASSPEAFIVSVSCSGDWTATSSDTWITLFWEHNFKGFFLGKIPLLKRLQWRENFTLKAAYGTVNARNDGRPGKQSVFEAPMLFPAGMNTLDKPYVEMGVGISNILKIIRVDCFWRCTHRERENPVTGEMEPVAGRFVLNFGLELRF